MPEAKKFDVAVIGGGIVGCATAMALVQRHALSLVVLEAEPKLAAHQTGNNSGVVHSGLYYKPGSLKATNCVQGREALYAFCAEWGIANDRCGKVVVATSPAEVPRLDELERRGRANGLADIKRLRPEEIREHEPQLQSKHSMMGLWLARRAREATSRWRWFIEAVPPAFPWLPAFRPADEVAGLAETRALAAVDAQVGGTRGDHALFETVLGDASQLVGSAVVNPIHDSLDARRVAAIPLHQHFSK